METLECKFLALFRSGKVKFAFQLKNQITVLKLYLRCLERAFSDLVLFFKTFLLYLELELWLIHNLVFNLFSLFTSIFNSNILAFIFGVYTYNFIFVLVPRNKSEYCIWSGMKTGFLVRSKYSLFIGYNFTEKESIREIYMTS